MRRVTTGAELREAVDTARRAGSRIGLVPTMGAMHDGHLSLVREAAAEVDFLVVSIFVNPTQFGPGEDLDAYPRDLEGDERKLAALAADAPDLVFAPSVMEVYPRPPATVVHVDDLTSVLCGASRPGHFDGVTTVVAKLLNLVQPDAAWFGRKDFQQLVVIRRMVADLDMPVSIHGAPIVRESDGLAMSSRNAYLAPDERMAARALSRSLRAAVLAARDPVQGDHALAQPGPLEAVVHAVDRVRAAAAGILDAEPRVDVDYVAVVDPDTLRPPDGAATMADRGEGGDGSSLLVAVAAFVGPTRLIDNVLIGDADDEQRLLAATDE